MKKILYILSGIIILFLGVYFDPQKDINSVTTENNIDTVVFPYWEKADSICGEDSRYTDSWCEVASGVEY